MEPRACGQLGCRASQRKADGVDAGFQEAFTGVFSRVVWSPCLPRTAVGLVFSSLLPSIQNDFSLSYSQIRLFTGLYGLVVMVVSVPAGILAKRVGA